MRQEANMEGADLLAGLRNGKWLDAQRFPALRYHLPGIIPEGFCLLVGPPKIGKSWFVLALGLGAAAGGRALGLQVDPRPVLYLALEDGDRRLQERCRTLLGDNPIPEAFEYITVVEPGEVLHTITAWLEPQPGVEPLLILDTLGKVMPAAVMGESAYQRDYRVGSALKRIADAHPGAAMLTNHHDRKAGGDDFVERVSGTNGLAGAADTIVVMTRRRHDTAGLVQVTGRDVAEGEYAVTFDGATGLWALEGGTLEAAAARAGQRRISDGIGDRMADVIDFVTDNPGAGPADLAAGLHLEPNVARVYLSRAVDQGRLRRIARGSYSPVASVAIAYPHTHTTQPHEYLEGSNDATLATPLLGGGERASDDNREPFRRGM